MSAREDQPPSPPPYDAERVGRVAKAIQISDVQLVHSHFHRRDASPLPGDSQVEDDYEVLLDMEWAREPSRNLIGYLLRFKVEAESDSGFNITAFFRLTYRHEAEAELDDGDLEQFGYWNAVFNAWPYFREFVSSTMNRAGLPRTILPVVGVPR